MLEYARSRANSYALAEERAICAPESPVAHVNSAIEKRTGLPRQRHLLRLRGLHSNNKMNTYTCRRAHLLRNTAMCRPYLSIRSLRILSFYNPSEAMATSAVIFLHGLVEACPVAIRADALTKLAINIQAFAVYFHAPAAVALSRRFVGCFAV